MESRSKMGTSIALIFGIVGFILALYYIFSVNSGVTHSGGAWFVGLFTLLTIIFSASMYSAKNTTPFVLNLICIIIAGIIAIVMGLWWILVCMVISLIGCIIYKASKNN